MDGDRGTIDQALDLLRAELQQAEASLRDIRSKIDISRGQVEQLAQKNASVIGEVRRAEAGLDPSIQQVYAEAMESQQRLLTIRYQMEKLQAQAEVIQSMIKTLNSAIKALEETRSKQEDPVQTIIQVINAQEEERERLARQMHDGPAHALTNFILQAEICQRLFDRNPDRARQELDSLQNSAREAFQRVRDFIFDLRPMMLTDLGLVPTVKRYLDTFEAKTGIETSFTLTGRDRRLESYREVLAFRGIHELLMNVREHAGASKVQVDLDMGDEHITARVEDNGRGFATGKLSLESSGSHTIGLSTLQKRLNLLGGSLKIDSASGRGSVIEFSIPAGPEVFEGGDL